MIFVDSTIWVSGIDHSDTLHDDGAAVLKAIAGGHDFSTITTDFVLDETLTLLRKRGAEAGRITEAIRGIVTSNKVVLLFVDEPLFQAGLVTFKKYPKLSFTDAISLTVMQQRRIREIFSHDSDFDIRGIVRKERP